MAKLYLASVLTVCVVLIFIRAEGQAAHPERCTNDPVAYPYLPICPKTTTETPETINEGSSAESGEADDHTEYTSTSTPTALERAHWCRLANGSYLPLGYIYMQGTCLKCECLSSRLIRCGAMDCMPTYCIDSSKPVRDASSCCTRCPYEVANTSCSYNGFSYQHGAIMKSVQNKMTCWCQLGAIECRNYTISLFSGPDIWSDGTTIYIIVIVIVFALILGLLTCCACTFFTYYYYYKYQSAIQQAYNEYNNTTGWEPVEEDQNPMDLAAEEKRMEAENNKYVVGAVENIPPPYPTVHTINVPAPLQQ